MAKGARRERGVRGLQWRCNYFGLCINMYVCVCLEEKACLVRGQICVCRVRQGEKGAKGEGHNALGEGDEIWCELVKV